MAKKCALFDLMKGESKYLYSKVTITLEHIILKKSDTLDKSHTRQVDSHG